MSFLSGPINNLLKGFQTTAQPLEETARLEMLGKDHQVSFTTWTGQQGHHWFDLGNWSNGLPAANHHAYIPQEPVGNRFPIFSGHCQIDYTIKNEGVISIDGELSILDKGLFQNEVVLENSAAARLHNYGNLTNKGTIVNTGFIENHHVLVNGHIIENKGSILGENQIIQLDELYQAGILDSANEALLNNTAVFS